MPKEGGKHVRVLTIKGHRLRKRKILTKEGLDQKSDAKLGML